MKRIGKIDTTSEYCKLIGVDVLHPLVSVIDFSKVKVNGPRLVDALSFGFYSIFYKEGKHCKIKYGRTHYDYQEGSLLFIGPNQMVSIEDEEDDYQPNGFALLFHPELLTRTSLAAGINEYSFFL